MTLYEFHSLHSLVLICSCSAPRRVITLVWNGTILSLPVPSEGPEYVECNLESFHPLSLAWLAKVEQGFEIGLGVWHPAFNSSFRHQLLSSLALLI